MDDMECDLDELLQASAAPVAGKPGKLSRLRKAAVAADPPPTARGSPPADAGLDLPERSQTSADKLADPTPTSPCDSPGPSGRTSSSTHTASKASDSESDGEDHWDEEDALLEEVLQEAEGKKSKKANKKARHRPAPTEKAKTSPDQDTPNGSQQAAQSTSSGASLQSGVAGALSDEDDDNTNDGHDSDGDGGVEHKDCIGAGKPAPLQPLAGVLAKLELRKQQIIARARGAAWRAPSHPQKLPQQSPVPPQAVQRQAVQLQPAVSAGQPEQAAAVQPSPLAFTDAEALEDDLLIVDDAEDAPAQPALESQMGPALHLSLDSQSQMPVEAVPSLRLNLDSQTQLPESQQLGAFGAEEIPQHGEAGLPSTEAPAKACSGAAAEAGKADAATASPSGSVSRQDHEPNSSPDPDIPHQGTSSIEGSAELGSGSREGSEEDEASDSGTDSSSSSSGEDEEEELQTEEQKRAALKAAIRDARRVLRDKPRKKAKNGFVEDEAEMSEDDEEHGASHGSGSDDDDEDAHEHARLLAGLIGHEKEGRHDERRRAGAHAAWQEQQDDEAVQKLLHGLKHGFRRRHASSALDVEGGSNREARRRRAALYAAGQAGADLDDSSDGSSGSEDDDDEDDDSPSGSKSRDRLRSTVLDMTEADIDAMTDEGARQQLREYREQQLLEQDQKQAAAELKLLDDDAQQVLAMFASNMAEPSVPKQAQQAAAGQLVAGRDITNLTNRRKQQPKPGTSFLGRSSHTQLHKTGTGHSNSRSYVFARDDSRSAQPPAAASNQESAVEAEPTSFAGLHKLAGTVRAAGSTGDQTGRLLGFLNNPRSVLPSKRSGSASITMMQGMLSTKRKAGL